MKSTRARNVRSGCDRDRELDRLAGAQLHRMTLRHLDHRALRIDRLQREQRALPVVT